MGMFEETHLSISQAKSISDIFIASQIYRWHFFRVGSENEQQ